MNQSRDGFSMVEVLVAMVLLAIILTTLAGFTFTTARAAIVATNSTTREALLLETMNRFNAMPFDQLADQAGCDTTGTPLDRYRRCADVTVASGSVRADVVISITPLQRGVPASVTRFVRPGPPQSSPLCTSGSC